MKNLTKIVLQKVGSLPLIVGLMIGLCLASLSAFAGWEPSRQEEASAVMDKTSATGQFIDFEDVSITLSRPKGAKIPTGLVVRFHQGNRMSAREFVAALRVTAERRDACGSVHYIARSYPGYLRTRDLNVVLSDHRSRHCASGNPSNSPWTAVVTSFDQVEDGVAEMTLVGDPEAYGRGQ